MKYTLQTLTPKLHPQWRSRLQTKCANQNAEIAIDQIRTISKQRLKRKIDKLSDVQSAQLRKIITAYVFFFKYHRFFHIEKRTVLISYY
jgi:mRNA-degrading endonuclease toxin of MazEF toxin-antitoxin module